MLVGNLGVKLEGIAAFDHLYMGDHELLNPEPLFRT
jgi:hypothetical protein